MDLKRIESLIEIAKDAAVTEVSIRQGGSTIVVKKPLRASAPVKKAVKSRPAEPAKQPEMPSNEEIIHAPMVGIFHVIDGITESSPVRKGQTVGAIESMKLMNELKSDADGIVAEAYVEEGMPVEYGQALFRLRKA
jgi:acetyl-CoA carboxylase biotin carboxyl carrier protein